MKDTSTENSKTLIKPSVYEMKAYEADGILTKLSYMLIRPPRFLYNPDIIKPNKKLK
jgi:hypothetical protein